MTTRKKKPSTLPEPPEPPEEVKEPAGRAFPIVGIGASAGGLAAFEAFFSGMPADKEPGMAFVLVQHLAPDHHSILTDLIRRYTRMQQEIVVVRNGQACLDALEQDRFDIVLMDIYMPVMNGADALREIRKKEQGTLDHQPIIAMTAYSLRGTRELLLNEGFDGYLSKPLMISVLLDEIKRVLGEAAA